MSASVPVWMWIVGFLLVLGPLVTLHELGHYLAGRVFGVKAEAFSVGFGRELAGYTDRRGTRWKLSLLPLGGYVQFKGDMNPASVPDREALARVPAQERRENFHLKPLWQRAIIVAAGPLTNLLIALVIFAAFNLAYGKLESTPQVAAFEERSDAQAAGVRIGDTIRAIDGNPIASFMEVYQYAALYPGKTVALAVERDGRQLTIPVELRAQERRDQFGNASKIGDLGVSFAIPTIGNFAMDSPAKAAGLQVGDRILAIDGKPVESFIDITELIEPNPGKTASVTVLRDDERLTYRVRLAERIVHGPNGKEARIGMLGIAASRGELVPVGLGEAITLSFQQNADTMKAMVTGLGQILVGDRSVKELGGPIKIAKFSGEQLSLGPEAFVAFVALISINLAFINLLPIPALDGGHLAFYAAEAIRRKPLGQRSQEWAFRTGIGLVLALMLFVTINDIASLPVFGG